MIQRQSDRQWSGLVFGLTVSRPVAEVQHLTPASPSFHSSRLMGSFRAVCRFDQIPDRSGRTFVVNELMIGVFRVGDEVFALDDRCPHAGASLARGYLEGDVVRCRIHHWGFRLRDGVYVDADSPCHNAKSIPARVREGQVEVWVDD